MSHTAIFFAAGVDTSALGGAYAGGTTVSGLTQILLVVGAILGVGAIVFLLVYLAKGQGSSRGIFPGGRRRRLRHHRPRNPTLAETGGLPPPREEAEPGPSVKP